MLHTNDDDEAIDIASPIEQMANHESDSDE